MNGSYIYIKGKKTQLFTAILIAFLWSMGISFAGDDPKTGLMADGLTLDQAIANAVEHSPKIKEARANIALAELDVKAAVWWRRLIPRLTVAEGYDFLSLQKRAQVALSLDLSKLLGEGSREERQAEIKLFNAQLYLGSIERQAGREAAQAFFEWASARDAVPVKEEILENNLKLQQILKIKFEHGSIEIDRLLSVGEAISAARLEVLKANQNVRLAEMKLVEAMGLPMENDRGGGD